METQMVEIGTIVANGQSFSAIGAVKDPARGIVVGYPKGGALLTWDGQPMGSCKVVSGWRTPRSHMSSHMYSYRAVVDGVRYHGRGMGDGMLLTLRRCKGQ